MQSATLRRHLGWAVLVGASYWMLARYSLALPVKSSGISYIWPADGVALASLLLARPRAWPIYLCAIFAGNFLASSKPVELNILYSLFNVCEPLLVATMIGRTLGLRPDLGSLENAGRFLALTVSCMAVAILITNTIDWLIHRGEFLHTWAIWYVSNTLGMLVVAPLAVCLRSQWRSEWIEATQAQRLEAVVVVASMVIATWLVFGYWVPPSADLALLPTGLPTVLLFWAALRVGLLGSLIALAILVLQAFRATAAGIGPFAHFSGDLNSALVLLQGSLMMITAWVLLSAARTVEWRRAIADNALARRRLEFAIEASGTVAFETHTTNSRILWSGDVANVLGIPEHRLASLADWRHHLHPEDRQGVLRAHARLATGRQPFLSIEYRLQRRDGPDVLVTEDAYAVPAPEHESGRPRPRMNLLGVLHNVTEARRAEDAKRRLEARLAQAQRLEAIGALAGGIAHDFNNILGAILGYAEMLEARTEPGSRARKFVQTIAAAGERGRALVAQTLAFSRTPEGDKRPVDLRILMEEVAATIAGSLPPGVRVRESIAAGALVTQGNATHLHQLAMNLCTNAVQAMPDGGELGIVLDVVENDAEHALRGGLLGPGRYVRLAIEDQGAGIDEAALPQDLRAVLLHQGVGQGHRAGPVDRPRRGPWPWRRDRRRSAQRRRHAFRGLSACKQRRGRRGGASGAAAGAQRPRRDDPGDRRRTGPGGNVAGHAGRARLRTRRVHLTHARACRVRGGAGAFFRRADRRDDAGAHRHAAVRAPAPECALVADPDCDRLRRRRIRSARGPGGRHARAQQALSQVRAGHGAGCRAGAALAPRLAKARRTSSMSGGRVLGTPK